MEPAAYTNTVRQTHYTIANAMNNYQDRFHSWPPFLFQFSFLPPHRESINLSDPQENND